MTSDASGKFRRRRALSSDAVELDATAADGLSVALFCYSFLLGAGLLGLAHHFARSVDAPGRPAAAGDSRLPLHSAGCAAPFRVVAFFAGRFLTGFSRATVLARLPGPAFPRCFIGAGPALVGVSGTAVRSKLVIGKAPLGAGCSYRLRALHAVTTRPAPLAALRAIGARGWPAVIVVCGRGGAQL